MLQSSGSIVPEHCLGILEVHKEQFYRTGRFKSFSMEFLFFHDLNKTTMALLCRETVFHHRFYSES